MRGKNKNVILGIISITCFIIIVILIFRTGKTEEVKYTGRLIEEAEKQSEGELTGEQLAKLTSNFPKQLPQQKESYLFPDERKPKMANSEIARLNANVIEERRKAALEKIKNPAKALENLDSDEKAKLERIQKMRREKAEKENG
ncbi:hypothetical protein KAH81_01845 [bacterium]|nr:hypothetical protein [bacterium]